MGELALVLAAIAVVAGLVSIAWGYALAAECRASGAALALAHRERDDALALAESRRVRLVDSAERALRRATGAQADADRAAEVRGALDAGDVDVAVERLLRIEAGRGAGGPGAPDAAGPHDAAGDAGAVG